MSTLSRLREGAASWRIHRESKTCHVSPCHNQSSQKSLPTRQSHSIWAAGALSQHSQSSSTRCILFINICSSCKLILNSMWSKRKSRTRITSHHLTISQIRWALIWVRQPCQASLEHRVWQQSQLATTISIWMSTTTKTVSGRHGIIAWQLVPTSCIPAQISQLKGKISDIWIQHKIAQRKAESWQMNLILSKPQATLKHQRGKSWQSNPR